ncbi:MAG: hypothetical protein VYE22_41095 [Myxococcota bacterium]|nr:hypothetical protein [Myxococcota bacterium]
MRHTIRTAALAALFALAAGCVPGTGPDAGAELDDATQPDASTAGARDAGEVWVSAYPFCLRIARLCSIECFRVECHRERASACIRAVEAAGTCAELEAEVCQDVCR